MTDKRTGKKKKQTRTTVTETLDLNQQAPVNVPKQTNTPPKK